ANDERSCKRSGGEQRRSCHGNLEDEATGSAAARGGTLSPAQLSSRRSYASRMRSVGTIWGSVQKEGRAPADEPFSNSLLTGAPPPHTEKYSQDARQAATPAWMSRWSALSRQAW